MEQNSKQSLNNPLPTLLDPPTVSRQLGVPVSTLAKWRCYGMEPGLRFTKVGKMVRYFADSVATYLDSRANGAAQNAG